MKLSVTTDELVKFRTKKLKVHANRIGKLCILWSTLEMDVTLLLSSILKIEDPKANNIVLGVMEASQKIIALKAISFAKKPSDDWYNSLSAVLKDVDDQIRPERNRMIHDLWFTVPTGTIRMNVSPKVVSVQSRQKELRLAATKEVTPKEISILCEKIEKCSALLINLKDDFERLSLP